MATKLELTRVFLTCHSKTCAKSQRKNRCTLSITLFHEDNGKTLAEELNERSFCTLSDDVPDWKVSPNKPGLRKLTRDANKENADLDLLDLIGETGLEIT